MARGGRGRHRTATSANGGQPDQWVNGHAAHYRIRKVRCGKKNCKKCPHAKYRYLVWRQGGKVKEKYVGIARDD